MKIKMEIKMFVVIFILQGLFVKTTQSALCPKLIKNPVNPGTYYETVDNKPVLRTCAPGTTFNKTLCKCDHTPVVTSVMNTLFSAGGKVGSAGSNSKQFRNVHQESAYQFFNQGNKVTSGSNSGSGIGGIQKVSTMMSSGKPSLAAGSSTSASGGTRQFKITLPFNPLLLKWSKTGNTGMWNGMGSGAWGGGSKGSSSGSWGVGGMNSGMQGSGGLNSGMWGVNSGQWGSTDMTGSGIGSGVWGSGSLNSGGVNSGMTGSSTGSGMWGSSQSSSGSSSSNKGWTSTAPWVKDLLFMGGNLRPHGQYTSYPIGGMSNIKVNVGGLTSSQLGSSSNGGAVFPFPGFPGIQSGNFKINGSSNYQFKREIVRFDNGKPVYRYLIRTGYNGQPFPLFMGKPVGPFPGISTQQIPMPYNGGALFHPSLMFGRFGSSGTVGGSSGSVTSGGSLGVRGTSGTWGARGGAGTNWDSRAVSSGGSQSDSGTWGTFNGVTKNLGSGIVTSGGSIGGSGTVGGSKGTSWDSGAVSSGGSHSGNLGTGTVASGTWGTSNGAGTSQDNVLTGTTLTKGGGGIHGTANTHVTHQNTIGTQKSKGYWSWVANANNPSKGKYVWVSATSSGTPTGSANSIHGAQSGNGRWQWVADATGTGKGQYVWTTSSSGVPLNSVSSNGLGYYTWVPDTAGSGSYKWVSSASGAGNMGGSATVNAELGSGVSIGTSSGGGLGLAPGNAFYNGAAFGGGAGNMGGSATVNAELGSGVSIGTSSGGGLGLAPGNALYNGAAFGGGAGSLASHVGIGASGHGIGQWGAGAGGVAGGHGSGYLGAGPGVAGGSWIGSYGSNEQFYGDMDPFMYLMATGAGGGSSSWENDSAEMES